MSIRLESGVSFEPAEGQPHCCPTCERPFEGYKDYPKIVIKDLVVSRVPGFVRDMPHETDIASKIRLYAKFPQVIDYLKKLSLAKGNIISLSEIKPELPEYNDPETPSYFKLTEHYYLHILDTDKPCIAKIAVMSHVNSRFGWGFTEIAKLAEIKYEGVLNEPPEDLLKGMIGAGRARS